MPFTDFPIVNASSYTALFQYANTTTDNYFGIVLLAVIFIVSLLGMLRRDMDALKAALAASYISLIASVLMRVLGLIKNEFVVLIMVMIAALLLLLWSND